MVDTDVRSVITAGAGDAGKRGLIGLLLPGVAAVGLLAGFGGGAAGLAGGSPRTVGVLPMAVDVYGCPDGDPIGTLHTDDRVLVTGRDKAGAWLEIRDPGRLAARVWIPATAATGDEGRPIADLPVVAGAGCSGATAGGGAPATPVDTTTTSIVSDTTTVPPDSTPSSIGATTTAPVPTTGTTAPATTNVPAPVISNLGANPGDIYESGGSGKCAMSAAITADVNGDAAQVTFTWATTPSGPSGQGVMTGGPTFSATLGPFAHPSGVPKNGGDVTVTVRAANVQGNFTTATTIVRLHEAEDC